MPEGALADITVLDRSELCRPGMLWKMSKTPGSIRSAACCLGEHNDYMYRELLGISDAEITRLRQEGHLGESCIGV